MAEIIHLREDKAAKERLETALWRLSLGYERMRHAIDDLQVSLQRAHERLEGVKKLFEQKEPKPDAD